MAGSGINMKDNSDDEVEKIDSLVSEFDDVQKSLKVAENNLLYWETQYSKLSENNSATKMRCDELEKKISVLKTMISETAERDEANAQKLKDLLNTAKSKWQERWDNIQQQMQKYTENFPRALAEYSMQNLTKDIEVYNTESQKLKDDILMMQKELGDLEIQCECENSDAGNIKDFDSLITDSGTDSKALANEIASTRNKLESTQNKIKRMKSQLGKC